MLPIVRHYRFNNKLIRVIRNHFRVFFVGVDVARALGYRNTRDALKKHVDNDDKNTVAIHDGIGNPNKVVINESGMFSLVLSSHLKRAKRFKHWVTKDVLPSIFHTGSYQVSQKPESRLNQLINGSIQDLDRRTTTNTKEISGLKHTVNNTMRVTSTEQYQLKNAEHRVVIDQLGGYNSSAYQRYSSKGFRQCWHDFKDHFNLPRYSDLPHGQFDNGLSFLSSWHLHGELLTDAHLANDQITLGE